MSIIKVLLQGMRLKLFSRKNRLALSLSGFPNAFGGMFQFSFVQSCCFSYTVSYVVGDGSFKHFLVERIPQGYQFLGTNQVVHEDLFDLVSYHEVYLFSLLFTIFVSFFHLFLLHLPYFVYFFEPYLPLFFTVFVLLLLNHLFYFLTSFFPVRSYYG